MAVGSRMGGESSSQHKSSLSNCSQLGQWPGADSFLTASVCVGGMQGHECLCLVRKIETSCVNDNRPIPTY